MIVTTTNSVEGYQITDYLGIVTGEAVSGINMFRDLGASMRNIFGGRCRPAQARSGPTPSWAPPSATRPSRA